MLFIALGLAALFVVANRRAALALAAPSVEVTRRTWLAGAGIAGWMALFSVAAGSGALSRFDARPPLLNLMMLLVLGGALFFARSRAGSDLVDGLPLSALVGFQAFRLPLELVMHEAARAGVMPTQMSFSGWNFDIVTGITACILAPLIAKGRAPRWLVVAWNAVGAILLAIIVGVAVSSTPLFHAFGDGAAINTFVAYLPFVFLPAVMVAFAIVGHVLVARWLLRHP
jgi:hypothetical protein